VCRRTQKTALVTLKEASRPEGADTRYNMLSNHTSYHDLGVKYLDHRDRLLTTRRAVYQIERLGYNLTLEMSVTVLSLQLIQAVRAELHIY
jgi:hypothetical protein